jgi:two-component system CheB/CheR fusion protein
MAGKRVSNREPDAGERARKGSNTPERSERNLEASAGDEQQIIPEAAPAQTETQKLKFPIVGVGASAGGLEAFSELLRALPERTGMAFVFIQHLDPKHVSALTEILARETKLRVMEARDGLRISPETVYVIPRRASISIADGRLGLGPRTSVGGQQTTVDTFFRSLAEHEGPRAIGVVLSGNASDGTIGLKAIKAAGGVAFAQDPSTAKFEGMPRSAIAAGCVDFVLKPAEIAAELMRLRTHPYVKTAAEALQKEEIPVFDDALTRILALVRNATGVDFSQYKPNTVKRRILRRVMLRRADTLEKYLEILRNDSSEVHALYEDVLINVTEFFRDPEVFEALNTIVFPRITQPRRNDRRQVRIWVPGCSTGEEVYSIAIALLEYLGDRSDETSIQIFATDLSESALEKARSGIYPAPITQNVSPERLRRFFTKVEAGYQIHKRVRELCVFARHNLTKDPPFSRLDLISCRNVLIYLGPILQERIIPTFHYALKPNGILLLGSSETVSAHPDLFALIHKRYKIYTRKPASSRIALDFAMEPLAPEAGHAPRRPKLWSEGDLQREADRMVLNRYGPPSVVIDDEMNVLQFRGQTGAFLEPASGAASLNLGRMLKEGLSAEVKGAVAKARKENHPVRREGLRIAGDPAHLVNVEVMPFKRRTAGQKRLLVAFELVPVEALVKGVKGPRSKRVAALEYENEQLRQELTNTKEYLQSIIEDQEAAHEELRSAAEEIQSSNEELQSTNEELETAKEELQSTNEELNTVNEELQNRNMQLTQIGNDLLNLLANVNIPILILGNDLRIRRFTPVTEKALGLIPSDVGRPIRDINLRILVPDLENLLLGVIENLTPQAADVKDREGRLYSLRVRPYRTEDNKIDGVVMVFVDMDLGASRPAGAGELDHPEYMHGVAPGPNGGGHADVGQWRGIASSLLLAQEDERRRLSHELHDELNQRLALLEVSMQHLEGQDEEDLRGGLQQLRKEVAGLSDDLRRIAYQLHPSILDDLGLVTAIQNYCAEFGQREGIQVRFTHRDIPAELPPTLALGLYRIVQEALRNVGKHSGAKRAAIALTRNGSKITLSVRDSGRGFDVATARLKGGLGLIGMQERVALLGGTLEISSAPGRGTELTATAPLDVLPREQRKSQQ